MRSIKNPHFYFKFFLNRHPRINIRQRFVFDRKSPFCWCAIERDLRPVQKPWNASSTTASNCRDYARSLCHWARHQMIVMFPFS